MTTAWLCITGTKTVGVLAGEALFIYCSSEGEPRALLWASGVNKSFALPQFPCSLFLEGAAVLSTWFVEPRQDSAMSVLYWMINKGKTNS